MERGVHFLSGLPRSGSTLLAAILAQNPALSAGMSSPLASLVSGLQRQMSQEHEGASFFDDRRREAVLRGVFDSYYSDVHSTKTVIDTNRRWCARMSLLEKLYPRSKVIACVRHMPWIVDSFERLARSNALEPSGIFNFDASGTVYTRFNQLTSSEGQVGEAFDALREAFWGEHSAKLMLVTYQTLTHDPASALAAVYEFLELTPFVHDFENIEFDAEAFDRRLGAPGLHHVRRAVRPNERMTVLPPDLFSRLEGDSFWSDPSRNIHHVRII